MPSGKKAVVTGGLSYIGKHITKQLLAQGYEVVILTGHPDRSNPFRDRVAISPFQFDDENGLTRTLRGAEVLVNTYWVRFCRGRVSFEQTVTDSRRLIGAAEKAGVGKLIHLSVSNPSDHSRFPYFNGKARVEKAIGESNLSYAILRPTLVFGGEEEILVNNISWLLRRFPFFAVPSPGTYRLQPIFIEDLAGFVAGPAMSMENRIRDMAGPEILTFEHLVCLVADQIGRRVPLIHLPPGLSLFLLRIVGVLVNDVVLTGDELGALMDELLVSHQPPVGTTRFSAWLRSHGEQLGRRYASELDRHFR